MLFLKFNFLILLLQYQILNILFLCSFNISLPQRYTGLILYFLLCLRKKANMIDQFCIGFIIRTNFMFQYLLFLLTSLKDWSAEPKRWEEAQVAQACWNIMNDVTFLPLVATESPVLIATAVIYTVFESNSINVIENKEEDGKRWFQVS